jgi:hypothetical protein
MTDLIHITVSIHPDRVAALHNHVEGYLQKPRRSTGKVSKFSTEDIEEIQRLFFTRAKKQVELASIYKCSQGTIATIVSTGASSKVQGKGSKSC